MIRRLTLCLIVILVPFFLLGLAVLGFDRSQRECWIGSTNLDVDFFVLAAESEEPIPAAQIEIRPGDGVCEEDPNVDLRTDAAGTARRELRNNLWTGTVSRLRFVDTYHVRVPCWRVRALAVGYEPSPWVRLDEDYRGKVQHEGPQRDRLVVRISLHKAPAEPQR